MDPEGLDSDSEFAVLIPILERGGEECVLLTKRPDSLPQFSGHVSLPGGAHDPGDADLAATAVRETGEEVGIEAGRIQVIAELPWHSTTLGHRVKPFVARVAPGPVEANAREVERILYVPVALLRGDPFRARTWTDPGGKAHPTYAFEFEGLEVWGLTARILRTCFVSGGYFPPRSSTCTP